MGIFRLAVLWGAGLACAGTVTIKVEIDGVTQGVFEAVEGLGSASKVARPAGDSSQGEPGATEWAPLILKRAYDPQLNGLCKWRQAVLDGQVARRDGSVILFDAQGEMAARWVFHRGWPSRWEVPTLDAGTEPPGMETVEIIHEGLTLVE